MNMLEPFDEIPTMTLKDIKETKRYRGMHACTDGQTHGHENSILPTNTVSRSIKMK